eukprot:221123_1
MSLIVYLYGMVILISVMRSDKINIKTHGPIEYCNMDPFRWQFEPLSSNDISRISSLKQVHILARHGARILPVPIRSILPNSTQKWECHWKTVNTRYYKTVKDWMSFKLHYVNNEQIVEGDCAVSSSLYQVIDQHRANAKMAREFYIGNEDYQLMSLSKLNDIAGQLTYYNQLSHNVDIPEIKIIAADYERTITSATVFMSEFLNINTPQVSMELYTHDYQSDPYTTTHDKNCPLIGKYIQHRGTKTRQYKTLMKSALMNATKHQWLQATGLNYSYENGEGAILMYCGGLDIPLKWQHFLNVLNMSYAIREAILANNETATETCRLAASPLAWLFKRLVLNHIISLREKAMEEKWAFETENEGYLSAKHAQLIYHSVHDVSILYLLQALGISNGREPMFAEMLTLEIYERSMTDPWYNKNIEQVTNELFENYLFRWTRKGKPLAMFPGCEAEYEYTQSTLCSLSVLMDALEYGENIKPWEETCAKVTEEYFGEVPARHKGKDNKDKKKTTGGSALSYGWTFVFGISVGIASVMFIQKYNAWFNFDTWKYEAVK